MPCGCSSYSASSYVPVGGTLTAYGDPLNYDGLGTLPIDPQWGSSPEEEIVFTNAGPAYNATATLVRGCTDRDATNFNSLANYDDGSCVYPTGPAVSGGGQVIRGCMDNTAMNYDSTATTPGECTYGTWSGGAQLPQQPSDPQQQPPQQQQPWVPEDGWFPASGTVCGGKLVPDAMATAGWKQDSTGTVFKPPNSDVAVREEELCGTGMLGFISAGGGDFDSMVAPPCVYSNTDYTGDLAGLGVSEEVTQMLLDAGIDFKSIDGSVCDVDKERILDFLVNLLSTLGNLDDVLDDYIPPWLARFITSIPPVDSFEGIANAALSLIQFGRGNFSTAFTTAITGFPGFGRWIEMLIERTAAYDPAMTYIDNSLSAEQKEVVLDNSELIWTPITIGYPPSAPFTALAQALILLGRKRWDEALEKFITMGIGKIAKKVFKPLIDEIKKIKDAAQAAAP